jgi:sugar/nucleoside kinase (ribokinase family)
LPDLQRPEILVVGDLIDDIVVVPDDRPRPDTDTLSSIRHVAGGSAANTAAWIGHLGGQARFVGIAGRGDVARHTALLEQHGVRAQLQGDRTLATGSIVLLIDGEHRTMFTERGANVALDCDAVSLDGAALLHLTGYTLFGALDGGASYARLIARAGVPVSVTPGSAGFIADYGVSRFTEVIAGATVLFPNLAEGQLLTGLNDADEVAGALAADFPVVALTLGAEGVLVASGAEVVRVAATPSTVLDPTGAGDAFAAAFLLEWVGSGNAVAAAKRGAVAAADAVRVIGGRP